MDEEKLEEWSACQAKVDEIDQQTKSQESKNQQAQLVVSLGMHSIVRVESAHEGITMKDYTERALREWLKSNAKVMQIYPGEGCE